MTTTCLYAVLCIVILGGLWGCATYQPMPLSPETVSAKLHPPNVQAMRIEARRIKHPLLPSLEVDLRDGLSPDEAAVLAVVVNPRLRAVRDQRGIARAQLFQTGILPNPQLSLSAAVPVAGDTQGTVNAFGVGVNWDLHALIQRKPAVDAAQARAAAVDLAIAWQEWQVAQAAKRHVLRLVALTRQMAVAQEVAKALEARRTLVEEAVALGEKTLRDLSAAEVAAQQAQLATLELEQGQAREHLALNRTLGLPAEPVLPLQHTITLPAWPVLPAAPKLLDDLENRRLDLLALKMGYNSQEAHVRAAIWSQFPKISIGFSQDRDTDNVYKTGFGMTIDLPFFDRNQGRIAIARASRQQLFDEYLARLFEARSEVARLLADMLAVKQQIQANQAALPALQRLVHTYDLAVQQGNADLLQYYGARHMLTTKTMHILQRQQQLAELGIALEIATGRYFPDAASTTAVPPPTHRQETSP